jgi:hypothetical protein
VAPAPDRESEPAEVICGLDYYQEHIVTAVGFMASRIFDLGLEEELVAYWPMYRFS